MFEMQDIVNAIVTGDEDKLKLLVFEAINRGDDAGDIMNNGLIAGMNIVGEKMEAEDMFIPEVLLSARTMTAGVDILKPHLADSDSDGLGTAVFGTVQGDLHDIGKNLVKMLIQGAGFTVIDLGTDVKPEDFLDAAKKNNATLIGMSALLTTTMPMMKQVIEAFKSAGLRDQVKIIIGGASVTQEYADKIGADGYGHDAGSAVRIAKSLTA